MENNGTKMTFDRKGYGRILLKRKKIFRKSRT